MPVPLQPQYQWLIDRLRDLGHDDGIRATAADTIERLCRRVDLWTRSNASALEQVRRFDEKLHDRDREVAQLRMALLALAGTRIGEREVLDPSQDPAERAAGLRKRLH